MKHQVPTNIPTHNQYLPAENLKSQDWLDKINSWAMKEQMLVNEKNTKCMIFNFTENHKFTTVHIPVEYLKNIYILEQSATVWYR